MKTFRNFLISALALIGLSHASSNAKPIVKTREVLIPVPVRANGFRFAGRSNGASRKKKTNRLKLSKLTRNKHR